jgi:nucleoside-diphosphate-sugar epimerase
MSRLRVLVTGGFGNIGLGTIRNLIEQGDEIRVFELDEERAHRAGHEVRHRVEARWGDICDGEAVASAVEDRDVVIHLAGILPPRANEEPELAERVNVGGMETLVAACGARPNPPRLLFASSFAVFGPTQHLAPPRQATDPTLATDVYSKHKIQAERSLATSNLPWSVLRFCDVPPLAPRRPHPMMFDIPLETRFETLHPDDAGLAVASAAHGETAWGRVLLVGGGPRCQVTYRDYLFTLLGRMGIGELPESAFTTVPHYGDWLDSAETNELWGYQRHTFESVVDDLARAFGTQAALARMLPPIARRFLLGLSPYYGERARDD